MFSAACMNMFCGLYDPLNPEHLCLRTGNLKRGPKADAIRENGLSPPRPPPAKVLAYSAWKTTPRSASPVPPGGSHLERNKRAR